MVVQDIKNIIDLENTYIGECPIDVDNCQWIRQASGATLIHFDKNTYDKLSFRIYVRGNSNQETLTRTKQLYDKLKNYVGDGFVIIVDRLPHYWGRDDKYRSTYSFDIEYQLGGY